MKKPPMMMMMMTTTSVKIQTKILPYFIVIVKNVLPQGTGTDLSHQMLTFADCFLDASFQAKEFPLKLHYGKNLSIDRGIIYT
jgi:hypothetical protein